MERSENSLTTKCYRYYNPFNNEMDTLGKFDSDGEWRKTIVTSKLKIENSKHFFECSFLDTFKFLHCDVEKNKLNGVCVLYFLPNCRDTAIVAEFRKNKLNGDYKYYAASGTLIIHRIYKRGKIKKRYHIEL